MKFHLTPRFVTGLALLFVLAASASADAQITGAISGRVKDETGAVLPGATVNVQQLETGIVRTVTTDAQGRYLASGLRVGEYQVEATFEGFKTVVRRGITLTIGREAIVDFAMSLGQIEEKLTVVSEAPLVNLSSATLGEVIDERMIRDLPLEGRDLARLALLQPNVSLARTAERGSTTGRGIPIAVSGIRPNQNLFMLDGTDINDALNQTPGGAAGTMTGVETIREFKVLTNTFSAEYGRGAAGGVFSAVTKSGTNDVHGSTFYFHRNSALDARSFFDRDPAHPDVRSDPPDFRRHQFGFTLGGPIRRNGTFFFGSYEGLRETLGITTTATVPTLDARRGILPSGINAVAPLAATLLNMYPTPNGRDLGGGIAEFISPRNQPTGEDYYSARIDHVFSAKHSAYARYTLSDSERTREGDLPVVIGSSISRNRNQYVTIEHQLVASQTMLNQARLGFNRSVLADETESPAIPELVFVPGSEAGSLSITGLTNLGSGDGTIFIVNAFQFTNDLSIVRSSHRMKMGVSVKYSQYNGNSERANAGTYNFRSLPEFYRLAADEFQGLFPGSDTTRSFRQTLYGFYFQDDYTPTPKLTLNLGVRYEFGTTPSEKHGRVSNLSNLSDTQMTEGILFNNPTYKEVAPRLGFAWSPFANGKTAVRGGFGMFFDPKLFYTYRNAAFRNPPHLRNVVLRNTIFPNAYELLATGTCADCLRVRPLELDPASTYNMQWNVTLQRQLGEASTFAVGYAGSRGKNLPITADVNVAEPEIQADGTKYFRAGLLRRYPTWDRMRMVSWQGDSTYHGLLMNVTRRFKQGLQTQASYTYSKTVDISSKAFGRGGFEGGQDFIMDPYDRERDRGLAEYHLRHVFTAHFTWDLPALSQPGALSKVFGGWQINSIVSLTSGTPLTPVIDARFDSDRDRSRDNSNRPNPNPAFSGDPILGTPDLWFDPNAFVLPEPGFYGLVGRNTLTGPAFATVDFSLVKNIDLTRGTRVQFRAEAFNILNRANFGKPNDVVFGAPGVVLPTAGRITTVATPGRQLQFGLKVTF